MQKQFEALGVKTVYSETYPADTTNFQTIAEHDRGSEAGPDRPGRGVRGRRQPGQAAPELSYSPKMLFQTSAPSNAKQYSDGIGAANTEGIFYTVCWSEKAPTPGNAEFVAEYQKQYRRRRSRPRTRPTRSPPPQVLQAAVRAVGSTRPGQAADWLHANGVRRSSAR